jgi:hypothetical protein
MKRLLVMALCAASLAVAAEALADTVIGGNISISGGSKRYFFVKGSCATLHPDGWDCVDLLPTAVYEVVNTNPTEVYLVVNGQRYLMFSDHAQAMFNQILAESGNNIAKARTRLEKELSPIVAMNEPTSRARIFSIFDRWGNLLPVKAPGAGSLKVIKTVVNMTGEKTPSTFPMTVSCTSSGSGPSNKSLSVAPGAGGSTLSGIAASSNCTVSEGKLAPILNVAGCKSGNAGGSASWTTTMSPSQPLTIIANTVVTLFVTNTLTCDVK